MSKTKAIMEMKEEWRDTDSWFPELYDGVEEPAKAAARQVGGTHYKGKKFEVWDIIDEYSLDYYRGNALKYILRNKMNTREDIEKAIHYLEKWLEVSNARS